MTDKTAKRIAINITNPVLNAESYDASVFLPTNEQPSRIHKPKTDTEYVDDVVTADERIAAFWRRHKNGRIETRVIRVNEIPTEETLGFNGNVLTRDEGDITYTVRVDVYKDADSDTPDATAHATRGTDDPDPVTAARPQETAETAAVSRALRYLGIRLAKTNK